MTAPVRFKCPNCGRRLRGDDRHQGRLVKCPECRKRFMFDAEFLVDLGANGSPSPDNTEPPFGFVSTPDGSPMSVNLVGTLDLPEEVETFDNQQQRAEPPNLGLVGRFILRAKLGQGGFGTVYRAWDPSLAREVALKVPRFEVTDTRRMKRFIEEGKAAARLQHPNIVAVYETGQTENQFYIATEFVDGQTLADRMKPDPVPLAESIRWLRGIALGLQHAHDRGVVHRDVKPANVMIGKGSVPRVMDFGLAKRLGEEVSISTMTADGDVLGTPAYMAPEQAKGDMERVGPLSDQYSLGVVMYELLTGVRPFDGPAYVVLTAILSMSPRRPSDIVPWVPQNLEQICLKAMAREPSDRYVSLNAFVADIDRWLLGQEIEASSPVAPSTQVTVPSHANSHGRLVLYLGVSTAILMAITIILSMVLFTDPVIRSSLANLGLVVVFWPLQRYVGGLFRFSSAWIFASWGSILSLLIPWAVRNGGPIAQNLLIVAIGFPIATVFLLGLAFAPIGIIWSLTLWVLVGSYIANELEIGGSKLHSPSSRRIVTAVLLSWTTIWLFLDPPYGRLGMVHEIRSWLFLTSPVLVAWNCRSQLRAGRSLWPIVIAMCCAWLSMVMAGWQWIPFDQYDPGRSWHGTLHGVVAAGVAAVVVGATPQIAKRPIFSLANIPARLSGLSVCTACGAGLWLIAYDTFRAEWWIQLTTFDSTVRTVSNLWLLSLCLYILSFVIGAFIERKRRGGTLRR